MSFISPFILFCYLYPPSLIKKIKIKKKKKKKYVKRCQIRAGTHKFKSAALVSGVSFQKSTLKKHEHMLPCKSSAPCPKLLARMPNFRSAVPKMIVV